MEAFLLLFISLAGVSGVRCEERLVQSSGPVVIKPRNSHTISCEGFGFTLSTYRMGWVRQTPDRRLQWLGYISSDGGSTYYDDSNKGRFTISRDNSKNLVFLQMTDVRNEDTGVYYCARYNYFDKWGPGVMVTVISAAEQAPSLFPLISCGTSQESTVTIGCLARDFLPESINFSWNDKSNNSFTNGLKTYKSVLQTSGTYAASSLVQVTTESWKKPDPYYCVAKHSLDTKVVQVVGKASSPPVSPVVTMAAPVKDDLHMNDNGTIVCIMSNYYPSDITVKWLKNHVETTLNTMTDKANTNADGTFVLSSFMTVSKKDWNEDTVFSCVVEHSASSFSEIRNVRKSQACESSGASGDIQVHVVPPSFESIYLDKKAPLTCVTTNMPSPDGLNVSWYELGSKIPLDTILDNVVNKHGSFSATATTTVSADDWFTKTFECRVKHPDLKPPKNVILAKDKGQDPQMPTVLLYPPHQDELHRKESVTLTCFAKHFYSKDIFVKWTSGDQEENRYVVTSEPMLESYSSGKKSYFLYSTLTIPSIETWNSGKSYTCVVGHESLPLLATQRSIDKTTSKKVCLMLFPMSCKE